MGYTNYSFSARADREVLTGYKTKSMSELFEQNEKRKMHESMVPKGIKVRECLDSEAHPSTIPVILSLDVTGSMRQIPHQLIKDGLPTLMGTLIQQGVNDASLLFLAVGDHECDKCPLQVGQFESGDLELDTWLTRTYLEGGGGGNGGESYLLAWYFAAFHTHTDSFHKRGKKGYMITVGDEPGLKHIPKNVLNEIIGGAEKGWTDLELLAEVQKKYHVYHVNIDHRNDAEAKAYWKELLGDNCIVINDYKDLPKAVAEIILQNEGSPAPVGTAMPSSEDIKITL